MKRRNFELTYMVPKGTDEQIFKRVVRTFQTKLSDEQIKKNVFETERAAGHWPLDFIFLNIDEV